jgi:uncharacterized protein
MQNSPRTDRSVSDLATLIGSMEPVLNEGVYVFTSVPHGYDLSGLAPIGMMTEREGLTLILEQGQARSAGLPVSFLAEWITLSVHSDLNAVGLTAAVATTLADAGISCNAVAAAFHDHVFVPVGSGKAAIEALLHLQNRHS